MKVNRWSNDRQEVLDLVNAVALKCRDCSCWSLNEVAKCFDTDCPLYPYRNDGVVTNAKLSDLMERRKKG